jgi:hypothetical protein
MGGSLTTKPTNTSPTGTRLLPNNHTEFEGSTRKSKLNYRLSQCVLYSNLGCVKSFLELRTPLLLKVLSSSRVRGDRGEAEALRVCRDNPSLVKDGSGARGVASLRWKEAQQLNPLQPLVVRGSCQHFQGGLVSRALTEVVINALESLVLDGRDAFLQLFGRLHQILQLSRAPNHFRPQAHQALALGIAELLAVDLHEGLGFGFSEVADIGFEVGSDLCKTNQGELVGAVAE